MTQKPDKQQTIPCALTVAGSDSGGGAGIQTDLRTFSAMRVHGTSIVTCITAQNPKEVRGIQPVSSRLVTQQFEAIQDGLVPSAVKTGMLYSSAIIQAVIGGLQRLQVKWYVMDPVMVATSGVRLLEAKGMHWIQKKLIPLAQLVTPNIAEAEVLLGEKIKGSSQAKAAVKKLVDHYETPFLLKGGHLPRQGKVVDYFYDGAALLPLESPYLKGRDTHGTGCTLAAAITAQLALGRDLPTAVAQGKSFIADSLRHAYKVGDYEALNPWETSLT